MSLDIRPTQPSAAAGGSRHRRRSSRQYLLFGLVLLAIAALIAGTSLALTSGSSHGHDDSSGTGATSTSPTTSVHTSPSTSSSVHTSPSTAASTETPSGQDIPVGNIPGWNEVYSQDFSGTSLPTGWDSYSGEASGTPASWFSPSHDVVSNGQLTLTGYPDAGHNASGGVGSYSATLRTYGKYEVRFRADANSDYLYALLLWPGNNIWPPEIDFAEDDGGTRQATTATLHFKNAASRIQNTLVGNYTQWHTAGVEWTPDKLVYTMDGVPWATVTGSEVPHEPMWLALQQQAITTSTPVGSTPSNIDIDWVVIYSPNPATASSTAASTSTSAAPSQTPGTTTGAGTP